MKIIGVARLGRDSEVRYTPDGKAVSNLSLAFSYGRKGQDGKRPTQWVDAALWGQRAEALHPYLVRGQQVDVVCNDSHVETFQKNDGSTGSKLVATILTIDLVGSAPQQDQPQQPQRQQAAPRQAPPAQRQQPQRTAPPPANTGSGFDDMDDIPFITCSMVYDMTTSKQRKMSRYDY